MRLYNTLTKQKELFEPVEPGKVGIYLCGPTVYKDSHIGHAVGPVIFDALKKYLTYKGYAVKLVINITDVDDKLIIEARERGISIGDLAAEVSAGYFAAMKELGVDSVDLYPRATEHISNIIELVQMLEKRDAAYAVNGDVYFDITKCKDYGKLSNRKAEDQLDGSRALEGGGKRNGADFALWKAAGEDELGWDSPWGKGRPGWHIECSAMSRCYLGDTFDIHGGGMDLIFPHHENEIAQSETATAKPMVKFWMHNGLTRVKTKAASGEWKTEKMSKSLGNVKELSGLLEELGGPLVRFFLLSTHYRRPIDFSDDSVEAVQKGMMSLYRLLERVERLSGEDVFKAKSQIIQDGAIATEEAGHVLVEELKRAQERYVEALDDDFNTAGAIAVLHDVCGMINRYIDEQKLEAQADAEALVAAVDGARLLTDLGQILGLLVGPIKSEAGGDELTEQLMNVLIELRAEARKDKNFALADAIRDKLGALDIELEDRQGGTGWKRV